MSDRLKELVRNAVIAEGDTGVEKLALRADVSPSTVRAVLKNGHIPQAKNVRKIAIACGLTEEQAMALACQSLKSA